MTPVQGSRRESFWRALGEPGGGVPTGGSGAGPLSQEQIASSEKSISEAEEGALKLRRLEAVLMLCRQPTNSRKLAQLADLADATESRTLIRQLNDRYDRVGRAMRVEQVAGGYVLLTRPQLAPWLRRLQYLPAISSLPHRF